MKHWYTWQTPWPNYVAHAFPAESQLTLPSGRSIGRHDSLCGQYKGFMGRLRSSAGRARCSVCERMIEQTEEEFLLL